MRIEHLAMYVNDLQVAKEFFMRYFSAEAGADYHNPNTGFSSCFLSFDDGARLELMSIQGLSDPKKNPLRTGYIHIAFSMGSRERVDQLTQQLGQDGYEIVSGPRVTGDGYYESCVAAIEGNLVEITV